MTRNKAAGPARSGRQRCVMAVVLGTALSAMGPSPQAVAGVPESTLQTVSDLNRYCTTCWRNAHIPPDRWDDCTQEVLCRLLERLTPESWSQVFQEEGMERTEFLRAIDTVKKRTQRARKYASLADNSLADTHEIHHRRTAEERRRVEEAGEKVLSTRQQRIVQMSLEGWSVNDIAQKLEVGPERISDEKYKAVQKLKRHLVS